MSLCVRGSLVFWLLTMTFIGAFLCPTTASKNVEGQIVVERNRRNHGESLDSPTNTAWKDWLLVEDTQPSPSDTNPGLLVRRITPKSVFVAPSFSGCSEGYRQDGMGRCVKLVKVNQAAQLDFLLQKLNAMYGAPNKNKNDHKESSGPFHVSLPLGGLENNNNNTPNDKEKETTSTSTTMKSTTEKVNETSSFSSSNSSSEIHIKKTELLHNTNLPITTTQSSQITTIEPQQRYNHTTSNDNNLETTTNMYNTNIDTLPTTTFRSPVEESQQHILTLNNFESTVKREPQNNYSNSNNNNNNNENEDLSYNTKKPFVIIVPNSTYRPFDSTGEETLNTNTDETIPFIGYDSSTITTTNKDVQTTTETTIQDSTSTIFNNNQDTMETITTNDGFKTISSTTTTLSNEEQPTTYSTTTMSIESEDLNSSTYFNTHTTTTMIPNTSSIDGQEYENTDQEGIIDEEEDTDESDEEDSRININDEDTASIFGAVIQENTNNNNKFIRGEPSRIPPTKIPGLSSIPLNIPTHIRTKCTGSNYGSPNINCEPEVTTIRYPVRTTTPKPIQSSYYVRFPVDTMNQSPSSASSLSNSYKKTNSYIRFPEQSSAASSSAMYASSSYGTKLWNADSSSVPSTMWYPPPSWFPFLQPHRTWSHDNNNHRNQPLQHQPMSSIYHKQYHQQHLLPQNLPSWMNTRSSWSQRD